MAIVANLGNSSEPIDPPMHTPNRSNAGTPNAVLTPVYAGEIVFDSTNKVLWMAVGLTNGEWIALTGEVT